MRERIRSLTAGWGPIDWFGAVVCLGAIVYLVGQVVRVGGF